MIPMGQPHPPTIFLPVGQAPRLPSFFLHPAAEGGRATAGD